MLLIRIEPASGNGLEAALVQKKMHSETALDQVCGEPEYVMKVVKDWLEITENLTTAKNI